MPTAPPALAAIRRAPKVLLHDHLDGGLRPSTVLELARSAGYERLPTRDVARLVRWFADAGHAPTLEAHLERFRHTVGVLQAVGAW